MEWQDQGAILSMRKHGESSAIIEVLTETHGRHAGMVRGGASRRMAAMLQPGTQVAVDWRARLEEHLGSFRVEMLKSRAGLLADRKELAALTSVCALVRFAFPERLDYPLLYRQTIALLDALETAENWPSRYALWEKLLLEQTGYGLDLSQCAVTGSVDDLAYVSPKTGRAVSGIAAGDWVERLLPLPSFLRGEEGETGQAEVLAALKTTGFFLQNWLAPALGDRTLPEARARLLSVLERVERNR